MRHIIRLALAAAAVALLPLSALAQGSGTGFFAQPFQFSDVNGPGTLTVTPLTSASTRLSYQPVQISLLQANVTSTGSGVYHAFSDDNASLPPFVLLSFTLVSPSQNARFFQVTLAAVNGYAGDGTHWPVATPGMTTPFHLQSTMALLSCQILNNAPALHSGWQANRFEEAIGAFYYSTLNASQTADATATWSGSVPSPGKYRIEVFIPRQPGSEVPLRTNHALYQVCAGDSFGPGFSVVNQQVATSQWVTLAICSLQESYKVTLSDQTGEPQQTRSVVADAVRLTRVP